MKKMMTRVEKLYYSKRADELFHEAREIFRIHGVMNAADATEYIMGRLATKSLPQKNLDELSEMVYAGLT